MNTRTRSATRTLEIASAAAAAVLSPIPLADEFVLGPTLLGVAAIVGRDQGLPLGAMPWKTLGKAALAGLAARASLNLAVSYVPGLAAVANATTAFALTRAYGSWAEDACRHPERARMPTKADILRALRRATKPMPGR